MAALRAGHWAPFPGQAVHRLDPVLLADRAWYSHQVHVGGLLACSPHAPAPAESHPPLLTDGAALPSPAAGPPERRDEQRSRGPGRHGGLVRACRLVGRRGHGAGVCGHHHTQLGPHLHGTGTWSLMGLRASLLPVAPASWGWGGVAGWWCVMSALRGGLGCNRTPGARRGGGGEACSSRQGARYAGRQAGARRAGRAWQEGLKPLSVPRVGPPSRVPLGLGWVGADWQQLTTCHARAMRRTAVPEAMLGPSAPVCLPPWRPSRPPPLSTPCRPLPCRCCACSCLVRQTDHIVGLGADDDLVKLVTDEAINHHPLMQVGAPATAAP